MSSAMPDFRALDEDLQQRVDRDELAGVSYAIVRAGGVVASKCIGWADREAKEPLREDHLFRAFSNTKLVTCIAALQLVQEGRVSLDDPVGRYAPAFGSVRVLRPGAASIDDTRPLREPLRVAHLLTHTAGLTYAFFEPELPVAGRTGRLERPTRWSPSERWSNVSRACLCFTSLATTGATRSPSTWCSAS